MTSQREAELLERIATLEKENALLRQKIDLLVRRVFGASSEKLDAAQLELLLGGDQSGKDLASSEKEEAASNVIPIDLAQMRKSSKPAKERTQRIPENLPCVEQIIEPEVVQANPQQWRYIGEEVSEQLDYEPARFLRRKLIRRKYVNRKEIDAVPVIAPLPPALQERCIAAPSLLAQVIVGKFCDHVPLYRQEQIYASRHGIWLPRQTLARWIGMVADWVAPVYEHIRQSVVNSGYIQIDETPVAYLEPGNGKTKQGYLWVCNQPGGSVVYHWHTSRAAACIEKIIPVDFKGVLQCDGYAAYSCFCKTVQNQIEIAGCLAHVRRKFYEAKEQAPQIAGWLLRQIQHLYQAEAELRKNRAGPKLRSAVRASTHRIIHQRIQRCLVRLKVSRRYLPKSNMGQAIDYALNQWETLQVYLENGRVEIDNNLVENAIRPTAIGKKNWLFIGEAEAGHRSAILYTLIENCRRLGIDSYAYLCDLLAKLPTLTNWQIQNVTPEAYAKSLKAQPLRAAS
jgi:transposase